MLEECLSRPRSFYFIQWKIGSQERVFYQQGSTVVGFKNGPSADDGFEDKAVRETEERGLCNSRGPTLRGCCSLKGREGAGELGDEGRFCQPSGITSSVEVTQGSGSRLNLRFVLRSLFLLVVPRCFPHLPSSLLQHVSRQLRGERPERPALFFF